ncbi:hypothetical protein J437_LFUL015565 [Ladona fulva]|uniref:Uncharacterized protein n=1 Tax=Ladona fulva TaxID=123851 RepID=A0A8K0KSV9_LADFU|nr:hypothetical protein J437_LFUL015565 [Ladona fulva]
MQNSVSTQADLHQTISADSNHLQTIYITTSPHQVTPAVAYLSVPHTVVNEVSETPQIKAGSPAKNNCQVFSMEEEVQVPTVNSSLNKNKENLVSSEEKGAEESEGIIHGSVFAEAQVRNIQQSCTVNRPNSQTETKRPSLQLIALSSSSTAASQTRATNSSCQLSTTQVSLPNGQQISLQDYRRMNPQINSVQPSKSLARGNSGVRQFPRVRRAARRGASIHSPVRQSSPANSLTPGRMILVDHSGEGEPMHVLVRKDSSQVIREQQQVATQQDSNT